MEIHTVNLMRMEWKQFNPSAWGCEGLTKNLDEDGVAESKFKEGKLLPEIITSAVCEIKCPS